MAYLFRFGKHTFKLIKKYSFKFNWPSYFWKCTNWAWLETNENYQSCRDSMVNSWWVMCKNNIEIWVFDWCFGCHLLWEEGRWSQRSLWIVAIPTIVFIIFWDFLKFHQIFFSPQVKRCAIITYKHGIYELPHKLPNNLRLRILGN